MTGGADRQRKTRRQRQRVEANLALDRLPLVECQCDAPAQPRTLDAAVEIVKNPFVAGDREARGQPDILRELVRRVEIEQRREVSTADPQVHAGFGLLRPGLSGALRLGVETRAKNLRLQPDRRTPGAAGRAFELRETLARRDGTVEAEQCKKRAALLRR